jgi:hypothetical protein
MTSSRFFNRMLRTFLARPLPVSKAKNPTCIKNTKNLQGWGPIGETTGQGQQQQVGTAAGKLFLIAISDSLAVRLQVVRIKHRDKYYDIMKAVLSYKHGSQHSLCTAINTAAATRAMPACRRTSGRNY